VNVLAEEDSTESTRFCMTFEIDAWVVVLEGVTSCGIGGCIEEVDDDDDDEDGVEAVAVVV
jgi:hypothetical protein